jgi:hypothetical protein
VSDDPEKTFAEAADHVIYQVNNYSEWLQAAGLQPLAPHLGDREALKQSGLLQVVDPDTAISVTRDFADADTPMPSRSPIFIRGRCRLGCRNGGRKSILSYSPRRSSQRFVHRIEGWALGIGHRRCEVHSR